MSKKVKCLRIVLGLILGGFPALAQQPEISYSLEEAAKVSLLIRDAEGRVVRELLHAAPRAAGPQREAWDGLDEDGQPVPAGAYTWKLLAGDGLRAEYLMSLGSSSVPSWLMAPGNHNGVVSVAVDEDGMVYLNAGCSEGPPEIVKQSLDGQRRMWDAGHVFDGWQGGASAAVLGERLYAMQVGGVVIVIDTETGKRVDRWDLAWNKEDKAEEDGLWRTMDLAGRGGTLVMSFKLRDAIRWIDPQSGAVVDEAAVPAPQSVAVAPDGRVFVLSHDTVVSLTRDAKKPVTLVAAGALRHAYRLDVCPATGDLLVAERGNARQVKRFDAQGTLLQTLGREGGRRYGVYDPNDFLDILDITADGEGGFIVAEGLAVPRRTGHFDRDGALVAEWYGGQMYANHAVADPADPRSVWVDSHFGTIMRVEVDYAARTWRVAETYAFGGSAQGLIPGTTHGGGRFVVRHRANQTYLLRDDNPVVLRVDREAGRLIPMVSSGGPIVHHWNDRPRLVKQAVFPDHDPASGPFPAVGWDPFGHRNWFWTDRVGEGTPRVEDITLGTFWGWNASRWYVDAQFNYYRLVNQEIQTMPLVGWTDEGVPLYGGWDGVESVPAVMPDWLQAMSKDPGARGSVDCVGVHPDDAGGWFAAFNNKNHGFGMGYMSSQVSANRVIRWDPEGRILWEVGRHSPDLGARPGEARHFFRIAGVAHGSVVVTDIECYYEIRNLVYAWDRDGLWMGRLLENPDLTVAPEAAYRLCTENFGGSLIEITADMDVPGLQTGDVIFFGSGQNDTRVYRITGWDRFRRAEGDVIVPDGFAAAAVARHQEELARENVVRIPRIAPSDVNADLAKWKDVTPLAIRSGERVVAKLYLGWNVRGLHACFDVSAPAVWESWSAAQAAFTDGAAVDLNVGPIEPADRVTPVVGDQRLVAAPVGAQGRTVLVEYLPHALPDMQAGSSRPLAFETQARGMVKFAHHGVRPENEVAARLRPDGGYTVEIRVPMRAPLRPVPGHRFRFDASVILADEILQGAMARLMWHSRAREDQLVSADRVIEATLRPANWGEAVLE